jgi:hypothetical protein
VCRVSNDGGTTWVNVTGDFWTMTGHATGNQTMINVQTVFA